MLINHILVKMKKREIEINRKKKKRIATRREESYGEVKMEERIRSCLGKIPPVKLV